MDPWWPIPVSDGWLRRTAGQSLRCRGWEMGNQLFIPWRRWVWTNLSVFQQSKGTGLEPGRNGSEYIKIYQIYIYIYCDRTPPWFPTTCNMFWYKDFLCCFFRFHFVRISSDFSSGALWQNVLPQDFATNSFVRISLGFRQNLNWSNEIFDEISTIFFVAKCCGKTFCHKAKFRPLSRFDEIFLVAKRFATTFCHKKKSSKFRPKLRWNFVKL